MSRGTRKSAVAILVALFMLVASTSSASPSQTNKNTNVSVVDVIKIFDDGGTAIDPPQVTGTSVAYTTKNRVTAYTVTRGLKPGGVYTYWWVIIPAGGSFPGDAYVDGRGGTVVGSDGTAFTAMTARNGNKSITGFIDGTHAPFARKLKTDLRTAEVHVEFAYHGQASDAGDDLDLWLSNFWSGTKCPAEGPAFNPGGVPGAEVNPGQPHCPVSFVAIHPSS